MAGNKKVVRYRCPICFNASNDIFIDCDDDGIYNCYRCGFNGDEVEVLKQYEYYRTRYKLLQKRITLEEQRNM